MMIIRELDENDFVIESIRRGLKDMEVLRKECETVE